MAFCFLSVPPSVSITAGTGCIFDTGGNVPVAADVAAGFFFHASLGIRGSAAGSPRRRMHSARVIRIFSHRELHGLSFAMFSL